MILPNLILELGLTAMFSIGNTHWPDKNDHQTPYLLIEKSVYESFYFKSLNSSRTKAQKIDCANPQTMLWTVEFGHKSELDGGLLKVAIGHTSEHEVSTQDKYTESYNYIAISYRMEYP